MKNIVREKIEKFIKDYCILADDKDEQEGFVTEEDRDSDKYDEYFDKICKEYYLFDYNRNCYYTLRSEILNSEQKLIRKILLSFSGSIEDLSTDEIKYNL